ncbi:MAG: sigma-70 family RNA polymerase sigma factor [Anaerolineae bacterium]|nr:MAG: sigma-70 family RNA polymerase sigma factor [Anaerolineae bacterium]
MLGTEKEAGLVVRAKQGDEKAVSQLYRQYAPGIYGYIASRVSDPALTDDLTSEVFLRALEGLPRFEYRGISFGAWLYRIAHDRVADHFRRQGRRPTVPLENGFLPAQNGIERQVETNLEAQRLKKAIGQLTADQQQVILLRFQSGLKLKETAYVLEKSVGAVKMLQLRALERLRELVDRTEMNRMADGER